MDDDVTSKHALIGARTMIQKPILKGYEDSAVTPHFPFMQYLARKLPLFLQGSCPGIPDFL